MANLPHDRLAPLTQILPLEQLTLSEAALARLAKEGIEHDVEVRADAVADELSAIVDEFEEAGVVSWTGDDRFEIRGGNWGHAFLRRAINEATNEALPTPARSYGTRVATTFFERACGVCSIEKGDQDLIYRLMVRREPHDGDRKLAELAAKINARDVLAIESSDVVSLYYVSDPPEATRDHILLVIVEFAAATDAHLSLDLEFIEVGSLFWMRREADPNNLEERLRGWFEDRADLLAAYRLRFVGLNVAAADAELADKMVAVAAPPTVVDRSVAYFQNADIDGGTVYLSRVAEAFEEQLARDPSPTVSNVASDAHQRVCFFAGVRRDPDIMERALRRATQLRSDQNALDTYNGAYLRALRGEYAAAADQARAASQEAEDGAFLLLFLPTLSGFVPPSPVWGTAWIPRNVDAVMATQAFVYDALAGKFNKIEFEAGAAPPSRSHFHPAEHRLIGWALATSLATSGKQASTSKRPETAATRWRMLRLRSLICNSGHELVTGHACEAITSRRRMPTLTIPLRLTAQR